MEVLKKYNVIPKNKEIYEEAFIHSSYCNEMNVDKDYQRLEFIGDKILDFVVSLYLYDNTDYQEGMMTRIRAKYVCEDALYKYSKSLNFSKYLKIGKGEEISGGRNRKAILADVFESFIGALYIDQGLEKTKEFIDDVVISNIVLEEEEMFKDYKSILQELVQTSKKSVKYKIIKEYGPAHDKTFEIVAVIEDIIYGKGIAKTKKEAEQKAAYDALKKQAKI